MPKRLLLLAAGVTLALAWVLVGRLVYGEPPLTTCGATALNTLDGKPFQGIDLCNFGWTEVILESVDAVDVKSDDIRAIRSFQQEESVVLASSVALSPDEHPHASGPVQGWRIGPTKLGGGDQHGLQIPLPRPGESARHLLIRYRYLGRSMELRLR